VAAKFRERLAVSKTAAKKFTGERFNLGKLNSVVVKKQYQVEIKIGLGITLKRISKPQVKEV
jgi:hypothetical protein